MSYNETFYDELHSYVQKIAAQIVDLDGGNPIVSGVIQEALGTYYIVQLKEGNYASSIRAVAINNNSFKVNDNIYLIKASNSLDNSYYIIGKVETLQEKYFNLTLADRFRVIEGGSIVCNKKNDSQINQIIDNENVITAIKTSGVFQIGGEFTCPTANDIAAPADYGVRVFLLKGSNIINTYELNTHYFIGQPFNMTNLQQIRTVQLDDSTLKSGFNQIKVETFGNNFSCSNITLSVGYLLEIDGKMKVSITTLNEKNYFSKIGTELENSIQLRAAITYDGQEFASDNTQYYWVIKDESINEENPYYLGLAGIGWRCLNNYTEQEGLSENDQTYTLQIWDNKSNSITFVENEREKFPNFSNTLKCIIKYQDISTASDEFKIYNYNREHFSAAIESSANPALLITQADQLTLTCQLKDEDPKSELDNYKIIYQWFIEDIKIENAISQNLIIASATEGDNEEKYDSENNIYYLKLEDNVISKNFKCKAIIKNKMTLVVVSEEEAQILVESKLAIAAQIKSPVCYKYYITSNPHVIFKKDGSNLWTGDWIIIDSTITEDKDPAVWNTTGLAQWEDGELVEGLVNKEALNNILAIELSTDKYLYTTYQTVWYEEKLGEQTGLRQDNWSYPRMAKGKTDKNNLLSDAALEKINTFNELTEGGVDQGVYLKDVYYKTEDEERKEGKVYYIKSDSGYSIYDGVLGLDKDYYELGEDRLYINAEFIQTGALRVADTSGNKLLYADISNNYVEIGGFTIDSSSIVKKHTETINEETSKEVVDVKLSTDGLIVGDALSIEKKDNKWAGQFKGSFTISGTEGNVASKDDVNTINSSIADLKDKDKIIEEGINGLNGKLYFTFSNNLFNTEIPVQGLIINTETTDNHDLIYFGTNNLIVNSDNFRLNYQNENYRPGALEIDTDPIKLLYKNNKYNLQINTDNLKITSDGKVEVIGKIVATSLEISAEATITDSTGSLATKKNITDLAEATLPATYFSVNPNTAQIELKAGALLYLESNKLVINSNNLKLNHDGEKQAFGAFMIKTDNFSINEDEGQISELKIGKEDVNYSDEVIIQEKEVQVEIYGEGTQIYPYISRAAVANSVYSLSMTFSKDYFNLGEDDNIIEARIIDTNSFSNVLGEEFQDVWVSNFTAEQITCHAMAPYSYISYSKRCKIIYSKIKEQSQQKKAFYLSAPDNSFYIRTTDNAKYSETFITNLNLISVNSETFIAKQAQVGRLNIDNTTISCEGMGLDFVYEAGDNNTSFEVFIYCISNSIILTASNNLGGLPPYDIQFVVRYKLSGNDNYLYTTMTLSKGQLYVRKDINSSFKVTEVQVQDFNNPTTYTNKITVDYRDDINGEHRGIGIIGGALLPERKNYQKNYDYFTGGGLGDYRRYWGWLYTHSLSLRGVDMPIFSYGSCHIDTQGDAWHSTEEITLDGKYRSTPLILVQIYPGNDAKTATLYVRPEITQGPQDEYTPTEVKFKIEYKNNNAEKGATIVWVAIGK